MKQIKSATVIGSGVMGAQIAAHLAGCGIEVWLIDLPAKEGNRSALAVKAKEGLKKAKPSPLYTSSALRLIKTGNLEDHLTQFTQVDWIIEAIVEKLEPKVDLFNKLCPHLKSDTILSTNTSGIPLSQMSSQLPSNVRGRFLGTHFFNPPRYLRLVEVISSPETSEETLKTITRCLQNQLNKVAVTALDVPCFIANRIGVYAMMSTLRLTKELGLSIEEVDALTGSLLGRPKTGTYKLADLVGLDTLGHILNNLYTTLPASEKEPFAIPPELKVLLDNGTLGKKTGAGFYKKDGKKSLVWDLKAKQYIESQKPQFEELKQAKKAESLSQKISLLMQAQGRGAEAARKILLDTLMYSLQMAPQISLDLLAVDEAMELGFGWEAGPFKVIDMIGKPTLEKLLATEKIPLPSLLQNQSGNFYQIQNGQRTISAYTGQKRLEKPPLGFSLAIHKASHKPIWTTASASLWDIQDGVTLLEFHSKMNTQDLVSLKAIQDAIITTSENHLGLVIANEAPNFCAGANIGMILMDAASGEYENILFAVQQFQKACMDIKFSPVPVVVSPHGLTLGGGCEISIHSPRPLASPETYIGLVEAGVGLIPAGGGTKEFALRVYLEQSENNQLNSLFHAFKTIATAQVATSAYEAFEMGYFQKNARVASNDSTRLSQAKAEVLALAAGGYRSPAPAREVAVLGKTALAAFEIGISQMKEAGFASEHDGQVASGVARVLAGGDVSPGTLVSEDYLLELEREEFMRLIATKKTQERIEYMLKNNKPLRN